MIGTLRKFRFMNFSNIKNLFIKNNNDIFKNSHLPVSNDKKIVYTIACYQSVTAKQVLRLIKAIYTEDNLYYINIDKKSTKKFYHSIRSGFLAKQKNIFFSNNRIDWGKWNQVQVLLDVIENALKIDTNWTHFINLSGQDFPLKNQAEIKKELANLEKQSFISGKHYPFGSKWSRKLWTLSNSPIKKNKSMRLDLMFPEIKFHKGSQWMVLSRNFCDYSINSDLSKKLIPLFKQAYIPDESFFPTMAANGDLTDSIVWEDKRFIDWSAGGAHPAILTINHLEKLNESSAWFSRKFDEATDQDIIAKLLERL